MGAKTPHWVLNKIWSVCYDCALLHKALISRLILGQQMVKVDLKDLVIRRKFRIPARSYMLHDTILRQILKQEPETSSYLKDTYFTYTRNGYFRFDYEALLSMSYLALKEESITVDEIEGCKRQLGDCVSNGSTPTVLPTPVEIAYVILGEDSYGCICEVVGYPLLHELVQKKLLIDPGENEIQNSILGCDEYLTRTFIKGLGGTDLTQASLCSSP